MNIDDYVDKGGIAGSILDNANSPLEFAAADSLVQSLDRGAHGSEPRKLRRLLKRKPKAKKGNRKSLHMRTARMPSANKKGSSNGRRKRAKNSTRRPMSDSEVTVPVYARYKATIRDPKHFYVSQVKFNGGLGTEETVYLYFNTPLSESDMEGLLHRSRVEILDPGYESIKFEDMSKLDAVDSKISWIYNEKDKMFHRFNPLSAIPKDVNENFNDGVEKALNEADQSIASIEDNALTENPELPMDTADDAVTPPVDDSVDADFPSDGSTGSIAADEGHEPSPDSIDNTMDSTDDARGNGTNLDALSTTVESGLMNDADVGNMGGVAESDDTTSTAESTGGSESSENSTNVTSTSVTGKRRKGSKGKSKNNRVTKGSYDLVDDDGNPVDRTQYKGAIDDEIASEANPDGTPLMNSYKSLNSEDITDGTPGVPNMSSNALTERNGNVKGDASKNPRGRRRKLANLWPRRRVQDEVVRAKKKVLNLEKRLSQAETKLDTVVRV